MDFDEVQIAVGPTVELSDKVTAYGGAVYHHVSGDWEVPSGMSGGLNEDGLGAYAEAQFQVSEEAAITAEFIFTDIAIAFAVSFLFGF